MATTDGFHIFILPVKRRNPLYPGSKKLEYPFSKNLILCLTLKSLTSAIETNALGSMIPSLVRRSPNS